jgi:hypothetical protein
LYDCDLSNIGNVAECAHSSPAGLSFTPKISLDC